MRASTLFGITIAGLLGLGVVVGAKYAGFFEPRTVAATEAPPIRVLVAKNNLFADAAISGDSTMVRDISPEEKSRYDAMKKDLLPPMVTAAHQRVLKRNLMAGEWITESDLYPLNLPDSLSKRLGKGKRAVNIVVPKEQAAGGLIQTGEYVDVFLTTLITCPGGDCTSPATRTAALAKGLRVIAKRGNLWTTMAPVSPTAEFTLEAGPYRAALIDFAKMHGQLSLVPTSSPEQGGQVIDIRAVEEDLDRDAKFLSGEMTIGEADLERIFNLRPLPPRIPPSKIERWTGINPTHTYVFDPATKLAMQAPTPGMIASGDGRPVSGYLFWNPINYSGTNNSGGTANCPTCGKK